jgi:hypothetical protein
MRFEGHDDLSLSACTQVMQAAWLPLAGRPEAWPSACLADIPCCARGPGWPGRWPRSRYSQHQSAESSGR